MSNTCKKRAGNSTLNEISTVRTQDLTNCPPSELAPQDNYTHSSTESSSETPEIDEYVGNNPIIGFPLPKNFDTIFRNNVIGILGSGSFGIVMAMEHIPTDMPVAIKRYDKDNEEDDSWRWEPIILSKLKHPNIVQMYLSHDTVKYIYVVMEFLDGQDLYTYMENRNNKILEEDARIFFRQIIQAVAYMHSKGVFHRDLKPANIFVCNYKMIKLIDFGLAAFKGENNPDATLTSNCGSAVFIAPEVYTGNYKGSCNDIWALGIVLYIMLYGKMPFTGKSDSALLREMQTGKFEIFGKISKNAEKLIYKMIVVDPLNRITMKEIMKNSWVTQDETFPIDNIAIYPREESLDIGIVEALSCLYMIDEIHIRSLLNSKHKNVISLHYNLALKRRDQIQSFCSVNVNLQYRIFKSEMNHSLQFVHHDELVWRKFVNMEKEDIFKRKDNAEESFFKRFTNKLRLNKTIETSTLKKDNNDTTFTKIIKKNKGKNIIWSNDYNYIIFKEKVIQNLVNFASDEGILSFKMAKDKIKVNFKSQKNYKNGVFILKIVKHENGYFGLARKHLTGDKWSYVRICSQLLENIKINDI